ncbi:MAG: hypothetical protein IT334_10470 [Thermomicrobiales bacterium]|nr:hypothetical protein [Thermomicrobiales bacterium]
MKTDLLSRTIDRRQFVFGAAAGAAAFAFLPAPSIFAAAQGADFSTLGYPELKVNITDTGYEGIPDSLPAGRYLLTATTATAVPTDMSPDQSPPAVAFVSPTPAGMSANDFLQLVSGGGGAPPAGATPEMGGTPPAGGDQGEGQQLPLSVYQMKFAGGTMIFPGMTSTQAVIDLTEGEWVAWSDDPTAPITPVVFAVTGAFPADVKDPEADITATLIDFAITMEGNLTAGTHTIKVQHHGAQPHFLDIEKGPDSMTKEEVEASIASQMSGTPAANGMDESAVQPVFYSPTQSIGTVTWHQIDLTAGTFVAACYFPTAGTGVPHAAEGMVDVFKVTG